jgi:pyruvate/2-oxoacid:ferredoxin oxidoreductase beta subunit
MVPKAKKLPRVFDYFTASDPFVGGTSFCAGCPAELTLRTVPKVLGNDIIIIGTPGCSAPVLFGQNVGAWHTLSSYSSVMTGVASSATGISRHFRKAGKDVTVVCFTGDGDASDVGFQPLSGAAERNENILYICYDNEGYMNTGNQRSSSTPLGAATTTTPVGPKSKGKRTVAKNLPIIMAMHPVAYVATATLSNMEDYAKKLLKAKEKSREGFAYLHVFCPCPVGWKMASDSAIKVCRAAVRTNYFPLWEMENNQFRFTFKVEDPRPIQEFTSLIGKYSHFNAEEIAQFQAAVNERYETILSLIEKSEKHIVKKQDSPV